MSGGGTKKTTTQQQTNQTVQLPEWMSRGGEQNYNAAAAWNNANPATAYTGRMTAGPSQNQQQASQVARSSVGQGREAVGAGQLMTMLGASGPARWVDPGTQQVATGQAAQQTYAPTVTAPMETAGGYNSVQTGPAPMVAARDAAAVDAQAFGYDASTVDPRMSPVINAMMTGTNRWDAAAADRYMDPYIGRVQNNVTERMARADAEERAALGDGLIGANAYGGVRHGVLESMMRDDQRRGARDYLDQSSSDAYRNAQAMFTSDEGRALQSGIANQSARLQGDIASGGFLMDLLGGNRDAINRALEITSGRETDVSVGNANRRTDVDVGNANRALDADQGNQTTRRDYDFRNADAETAARRDTADWANIASGRNADRGLTAERDNASFIDQMLGRNTGNEQAMRLANLGFENAGFAGDADRALTASRDNAGIHQSMLDRLLAGGAQMGDLGVTERNMATADISDLMRTGASEQATEQAELDARYNEFLRMQDAPMERYAMLAQILGGTPRNVNTSGTMSGTGTEKTSGNLLQTLLGAGQLAASFIPSDRRLKRDVSLLGRLASGLGVYAYRYLWDGAGPLRLGVMADEVARIVPEALGPTIGGYATVNYSKLGAAA